MVGYGEMNGEVGVMDIMVYCVFYDSFMGWFKWGVVVVFIVVVIVVVVIV